MKPKGLLARVEWLFEEDSADEPAYDPVHLGAAVLLSFTAIGLLYWLLWTLLVYEGGIFLKASALARVLFTSATLKDLGYEGYPYQMGAFEGWYGNLGALAVTVVVVAALRRLYLDAARRRG